MKDQKITKASLLQSKAKTMADRNERFVIIEKEVRSLKDEVLSKLGQLSLNIKSHLDQDV